MKLLPSLLKHFSSVLSLFILNINICLLIYLNIYLLYISKNIVLKKF